MGNFSLVCFATGIANVTDRRIPSGIVSQPFSVVNSYGFGTADMGCCISREKIKTKIR
jgi:hypothetical protein